MSFYSLEDIVHVSSKKDIPFWRAVLLDDMEDRMVTEARSVAEMEHTWEVMLSASENYDPSARSVTGMTGGDGALFEAYAASQSPYCAGYMAKVLVEALKMAESNACMKRIVAAPTAGSCGVLPSVLIPLWHSGEYQKEDMIAALYTAGGIGSVIAHRASISGAAGGCQAEVGSAAAMAAGALVSLRSDGEAIIHASAIALKNLMGLICDSVAGFVEVPCIKRNVAGAFVAVSAADMALAGIRSRIPPDEVVDAMGSVGAELPLKFRETALGGLADTPTGITIRHKLEEEGILS